MNCQLPGGRYTAINRHAAKMTFVAHCKAICTPSHGKPRPISSVNPEPVRRSFTGFFEGYRSRSPWVQLFW
ncbi:hypothetical protein TNCV_1943521 [Trichonephila clavipes]|nr:hypothetical protein TNCV_1943521 [Trichonephila clavipes]